jgi:hypothetical protein
MALASSVFPVPGGPSTRIGFPSSRDRYRMVIILSSGMYLASERAFFIYSGLKIVSFFESDLLGIMKITSPN